MNSKAKITIILVLVVCVTIILSITVSRHKVRYNYSPNGYIECGYNQVIEGNGFTFRLVKLTIGHNYTITYNTVNQTLTEYQIQITYFITPNHNYFEITIRDIQFISDSYRHEIRLYHNNIWIDYLRFEVISLEYLLNQGD